MLTRLLPPALTLALGLTLAACGNDEPTVAERFNSLKAEVENEAVTIDAEANNMVTDEQRRLDAETDALQRANENAMAADEANQAGSNAQ